MKRMRGVQSGLVMLIFAVAGTAHSQDLTPADPPGPGMHPLPSISDAGPDLLARYKNDPMMLRTLREQARLKGEERQKQMVEATDLLLKTAESLRAEMARKPGAIPTETENEHLQQVRKLARMIGEREKEEDELSLELAKAGVWP